MAMAPPLDPTDYEVTFNPNPAFRSSGPRSVAMGDHSTLRSSSSPADLVGEFLDDDPLAPLHTVSDIISAHARAYSATPARTTQKLRSNFIGRDYTRSRQRVSVCDRIKRSTMNIRPVTMDTSMVTHPPSDPRIRQWVCDNDSVTELVPPSAYLATRPLAPSMTPVQHDPVPMVYSRLPTEPTVVEYIRPSHAKSTPGSISVMTAVQTATPPRPQRPSDATAESRALSRQARPRQPPSTSSHRPCDFNMSISDTRAPAPTTHQPSPPTGEQPCFDPSQDHVVSAPAESVVPMIGQPISQSVGYTTGYGVPPVGYPGGISGAQTVVPVAGYQHPHVGYTNPPTGYGGVPNEVTGIGYHGAQNGVVYQSVAPDGSVYRYPPPAVFPPSVGVPWVSPQYSQAAPATQAPRDPGYTPALTAASLSVSVTTAPTIPANTTPTAPIIMAPVAPTATPATYCDLADSDTTGLQGCDEHSVPFCSRQWVAEAFQYVLRDEDGQYRADAVYSVLRATAPITGDRPPLPGRPAVCFFCKEPGHRWMRCFRLRDVLLRNGMKLLAYQPSGPGTDRETVQVLSVPNQTGNPTQPAQPTPQLLEGVCTKCHAPTLAPAPFHEGVSAPRPRRPSRGNHRHEGVSPPTDPETSSGELPVHRMAVVPHPDVLKPDEGDNQAAHIYSDPVRPTSLSSKSDPDQSPDPMGLLEELCCPWEVTVQDRHTDSAQTAESDSPTTQNRQSRPPTSSGPSRHRQRKRSRRSSSDTPKPASKTRRQKPVITSDPETSEATPPPARPSQPRCHVRKPARYR